MSLAEVYVYNRTTSRAEGLVSEMNATESATNFRVLESLEATESLPRLDAVMGTVPGAAALSVPLSVLERHTPIVMDAAYQSSATGSRFTTLLQGGRKFGCHTIEGLEMLFEQGCAQCERWTGLPAPRAEIAAAMIEARFKDDPEPPRNLMQEASQLK